MDWEEAERVLGELDRAWQPQFTVSIRGSRPVDTYIYIAYKLREGDDPTVLRLPAPNYSAVALTWLSRIKQLELATPTLFWMGQMVADLAREWKEFRTGGTKPTLYVPGGE